MSWLERIALPREDCQLERMSEESEKMSSVGRVCFLGAQFGAEIEEGVCADLLGERPRRAEDRQGWL